MIADRQTHELPERPAELARFAIFLGYADAAEFAARVAASICPGARALCGGVRAGAGAAAARRHRDWSWISAASAPRPATRWPRCAARLRQSRSHRGGGARLAGRACPGAALGARARADRRRCCRACWPRSARQPQPDTVFSRFDAFLARLPAGVQLLSLFQRNPALIDRIAAVLGAAPSLADHLASHPAALDGLLSPEDDPDPARLLRAASARCAPAGGRHRDHPPHRARGGFHRLRRHHGGAAGRRRRRPAAHRDCRCGAERLADAGAGRLRHAFRPGARRRHGRGGAGQGGWAGDDGRLRPRSDAGLRPSGRRQPTSRGEARACRSASGSCAPRMPMSRR